MPSAEVVKEDKGKGRISHIEARTMEIKALQEEKLKHDQDTIPPPGVGGRRGAPKCLPQGTLSLGCPLGKGKNILLFQRDSELNMW